MKLTAIILLAGCLQLSAKGVGQNISLSLKDEPLLKLFKEIERQTDYTFFYDIERLQQAKKVTVQVNNLPVSQVLELCFKDQPFTYAIWGKNITIAVKKATSKKEPGNPANESIEVNNTPPLIDVQGVITDENGAPAQGVNVMVKGTNKGTTTNYKGEFVLRDVNENAILLITSVGYDRQEILVKNKSFITAQLKVAVGNLDELQVIAYGTTTKRFQTGNVATVKAADIEKQPVQNPLLTLQGRVPGLFISQNTGSPGGAVTVRIQGQNSIRSGNDPLYIVDGVPYTIQLPNTGIGRNILGNSGASLGGVGDGNPLNYINPADIERIEVLKDADATAIYGSRAANGAILITTKKGKPGKMKIDANMQHGWGKITRSMEMLKTEEYLEMRKEAFLNDNIAIPSISTSPTNTDYDINGFWDTTRYTDWQNELIGGTAEYTNINIGISGGNSQVRYLMGGTYHRETTVFPGNFSDKKASVHISLAGSSLNKKLQFEMSGNYMVDNNQLPSFDLTADAIQLAPNAPSLYNSDGSLNWMLTNIGKTTFFNPLRRIYQTYENETNNLISNLQLNYEVLSGLNIKSSFGYTYMQTNDYSPTPMIAIQPDRRGTTNRSALYGDRNIKTWIIEPQITYKKVFSKSTFDALLGYTVQENNSRGRLFQGLGFSSDANLSDITSAPSISAFNAYLTEYKYVALFGRVNYNLLNRYIVNITARRDGSSRFGSKNQFHNFGSVGLGWLFSEELLLQKINFLSFGKLRASYGTTGNDQIGDYSFMNLYYPFSVEVAYQNTVGIIPNGLYNEYLEWEETKKLQVGIDLGFIKNRISLNATLARNRSSNQLLPYVLPGSTGFDNIITNFPATVQNTSLELMLQTINVQSKFLVWNSNFNLTIPRNKVIEFPGLENSSYANTLVIGQPIGVAKVFPFVGVDPVTGKYLYRDATGALTFTPNGLTDRSILLNPMPKFYGGFQNSLSYKKFQLEFLFQFVKQIGTGFTFFNNSQYPGQFSGSWGNQPVDVLDRWRKPGDIAAVAAFSTKSITRITTSERFYSDASFVRLKNLSLSWQVPEHWKKKARLQNVRIYLQGQNLLTFTKYAGLDPENRGTAYLPPLRILTVGIQIAL